MKTIFTFGTSTNQPFQGGWVEIEAKSQSEAVRIFNTLFPPGISGLVRCAGIYPEEQFNATRMPIRGNFGQKCRLYIKEGAFDE